MKLRFLVRLLLVIISLVFALRAFNGLSHRAAPATGRACVAR